MIIAYGFYGLKKTITHNSLKNNVHGVRILSKIMVKDSLLIKDLQFIMK